MLSPVVSLQSCRLAVGNTINKASLNRKHVVHVTQRRRTVLQAGEDIQDADEAGTLPEEEASREQQQRRRQAKAPEAPQEPKISTEERVKKQLEEQEANASQTGYSEFDESNPDTIRGFTWDELTSVEITKRDYSFQQGVTTKEPAEELLQRWQKGYGRSHRGHGKILHKQRGGGKRYLYRKIDFLRDKILYPATVEEVEWDPWRSAKIARVRYDDGERRYILYPAGLRIGDVVESGPSVRISPGNCLPLEGIPIGTFVHNVEFKPGNGGALARAAGMKCRIMGRRVVSWRGMDQDFTILQLPSKEVRMVPSLCWATIGIVGDSKHDRTQPLGKAGIRRWLGWRPHVRGSAMNACDHPHGGGKDKQPLGKPQKWLGRKTRSGKLYSWQLIIRRRRIGYGMD